MLNKTTYPKAKLAEIKKRGGEWIAADLIIDMKLQTGKFETLDDAKRAAKWKMMHMTTRQLYAFLKDNGYTFNVARACWQSAETESQS